ncbi:glycosyl hydrolase family 65 protein, partial [Actinacidiphila rubida]
LTLRPTLPAGWGDVTLRGLHYRDADLTIALHGAGTTVQSFTIDGKRVHGAATLPATLTGDHTVEITL